jgi:hypothetical protein
MIEQAFWLPASMIAIARDLSFRNPYIIDRQSSLSNTLRCVMKYWLCGGICLFLFGITTADSQEKKKSKPHPTYTSEKEAGPDFAIQGESVGEVQKKDGEKHKIGGQVVALGDGKFRVKFHVGGLPGAGWDGKTLRFAQAETKDGQTVFHGKLTNPDPKAKGAPKEITGTIAGGVMTVTVDDTTSTFKRVDRKSPTEGAKPPSGAIVLFDGSTADQWKGGKLVEGNLLNMGVYSKQEFKDLKAHIEFRLPFQPNDRGQGRGNSGFYPHGHDYEVQILDSFGLKGENNECGGLYTIRAPKVNMCFPPLSWQTYDVDFKAPRFDAEGKKIANAVITVAHNGVTIHDHVELPKCTEDHNRKIEDKPGAIHLQNHGNPVYFRNIWVVETK